MLARILRAARFRRGIAVRADANFAKVRKMPISN